MLENQQLLNSNIAQSGEHTRQHFAQRLLNILAALILRSIRSLV